MLSAQARSRSRSSSPLRQRLLRRSRRRRCQINVLVGQSRVINFDRQIGRFSVSNPEVAEAVLVAPDQVLVNGKAFGQVNFIAWEKSGGKFVVFDVFVRANLSLIDSQIRALFPKDDIRLSQANGSVVMSGSVDDPKTAQQADAVVQAAGFKTVNMLETPVDRHDAGAAPGARGRGEPQQDEGARRRHTASRTARTGGYLNSGNGPTQLRDDASTPPAAPSTTLACAGAQSVSRQRHGGPGGNAARAQFGRRDALALAEPNLIAMNGQQASFLAGGEFPVPIVQSERRQDRRRHRVEGVRRPPQLQADDHRRGSHPPGA